MAVASKIRSNHPIGQLKVITPHYSASTHCHKIPTDHYKMTAKIRGPCLIINNSEFSKTTFTSAGNSDNYHDDSCVYREIDNVSSSVNNGDLTKKNNNNDDNNNSNSVRRNNCCCANVTQKQTNYSELPQRPWSFDDARNLENVFQQLGFDVHVENNLTASDMLHSFRSTADKCKAEHDALFVIVLTHGNENHLYGSDGKAIDIHDMIDCFDNRRCKAMLGKPKVFLMQSVLYRRQRLQHYHYHISPASLAQGIENRPFCNNENVENYLSYQLTGIEPCLLNADRVDSSSTSHKTELKSSECLISGQTEKDAKASTTGMDNKSVVVSAKDCRLPIKTDMLLCFCCLGLGYATDRDEVSGSFMSVALTYYLMTCAHNRDFLSILKMITREWAQKESGQAQTLELKCYGWKKFLYFNPGLVIDDRDIIDDPGS